MSRPALRPTLRPAAPMLALVVAMIAMPVFRQSAPEASAQGAPAGTVRLSPAMSTVPAADGPFTVYVVLEGLQHLGNVSYDDNRDGQPDRNVPSHGLGAFEFTIEYNDAIVEYHGVERGPSLNSTGRSFQCLGANAKPGAITFGCLSPGGETAGPQGTLTLAAVQFLPKGNGLSPLILDAEVAGPLGDSVEVSIGGGAARVSGATSATDPTNTPPGSSATPGQTGDRPATTGPTDPSASATSGRPATTPNPTEAGQTATAVAQAAADATRTVVPADCAEQDRACIEAQAEDDGGSNYVWVWLVGGAVAVSLATVGIGGIFLRGRS